MGAPSGSAARADRSILFSSPRDGDFEIYVMDADGGNLVQLTKNTTWDWQPDWH